MQSSSSAREERGVRHVYGRCFAGTEYSQPRQHACPRMSQKEARKQRQCKHQNIEISRITQNVVTRGGRERKGEERCNGKCHTARARCPVHACCATSMQNVSCEGKSTSHPIINVAAVTPLLCRHVLPTATFWESCRRASRVTIQSSSQ